MIVLSQQNQQAKKKLTDFLLNNNVTFTPSQNQSFEAVVRIKLKKENNFYLLINQKITDYTNQINQLKSFRGLHTELRRKQIDKLNQQRQEFLNILEIYQRSHKFSEQLKSIFYVAVYYHWLQHEFIPRDIQLSEIVELFKSIFFSNIINEPTNQRQQKLLQFCLLTYKSQYFQDKINKPQLKSTSKENHPRSASIQKQPKAISQLNKQQQQQQQQQQQLQQLLPQPQPQQQQQQRSLSSNQQQQQQLSINKSQSPVKKSLEQLSTQQLHNYYNRMIKTPNTELKRRNSPVSVNKTPPKSVFKV